MVMKGIALWTQRSSRASCSSSLVVTWCGAIRGQPPPSLRKQLAGVGLGLIHYLLALAMIAKRRARRHRAYSSRLLWILIIGDGRVAIAHHSDASATEWRC